MERMAERKVRGLRCRGGDHPLSDYHDGFRRTVPAFGLSSNPDEYAAEGIATARSDTWVAFETDGYKWRNDARNVYAVLFGSADDADAELVVQKSTANGLMLRQGDMSVTCQINNYIIYQEVVVTAVDTVHVPIDLSFVKFPNTIDLTTSSTAVVQNGDEFVRNMDIAADFVKYLDQRFGISTSEAFVRVKEVIGKLTTFLQGKG